MKPRTVHIHWQRLVQDGRTCPRCGDTEKVLRQTTEQLQQALRPLGVEVLFEASEITSEDFAHDPQSSNAIQINGRPLEQWLGAATGQSACCDVCGPNDCRTLVLNGTEYEGIPAELVIRAVLQAAASLFTPPPALKRL